MSWWEKYGSVQDNQTWSFILKSSHDADDEINNAGLPEYPADKNTAHNQQFSKRRYRSSQWVACSSQTAGDFTAVGYFFARELLTVCMCLLV